MSEKIVVKTVFGEETQVDKTDLSLAVNVYGVIVKDNKIVISPQWQDNGFDFPGGHLELGETTEATLVREVKEETGFDIKPLEIIDVFTSFFMHPRKQKPQQSIMIYYSAEIVGGKLSADGFDTHEHEYAKMARFATLDEIKKMKYMCSTQEPLKSIIPFLESSLT
jgi:8-oxo-dGTP pyrophosphatase MutT (NUDIX family)